MTDYNKRTYRVDDVTWKESPLSTFKMRDETISYIDYYKKVQSYINFCCNVLYLFTIIMRKLGYIAEI